MLPINQPKTEFLALKASFQKNRLFYQRLHCANAEIGRLTSPRFYWALAFSGGVWVIGS
jgi:hypothetical protein